MKKITNLILYNKSDHKTPNKRLLKAFKDAKERKNITVYKDVELLLSDLKK